MGSFGDYLAGLGGDGGAPPPPQAGTPATYAIPTVGEPVPYLMPGTGGGAAVQQPSINDQLDRGYTKAAGIVTRGSQGAGDLLTNSYRSALRRRLAGNAGALALQQETIGSQRYAPDVAARLSYAPRAANLQETGQAIGETGAALGSDQAQLLKGTATELAGLTTEQLSNLVNIKIAKDAASATKSAGALGALGSIGGGIAGALPFL